MSYRLVYTQRAIKDIQKLEHPPRTDQRPISRGENLSRSVGLTKNKLLAYDLQIFTDSHRG